MPDSTEVPMNDAEKFARTGMIDAEWMDAPMGPPKLPPEVEAVVLDATEKWMNGSDPSTAALVRSVALAVLALREEEVEKLKEHEEQTHQILGVILGTDDSLENVSRRAVAHISALTSEVERLREDQSILLNYAMELRGGWDWKRNSTEQNNKAMAELDAIIARLTPTEKGEGG